MTRKLTLFLTLFFFFSILQADEIKRKLLVIHSEKDKHHLENVHRKLESILNYYGYFAEHIESDNLTLPDHIDNYAGLVMWNYSLDTDNPLKLMELIVKFKDKKNIFIGNIPYKDKQGKEYFKEVNTILKENFQFSMGKSWSKDLSLVNRKYEKSLFDFEKKISFLTNKAYSQILIHNKNFKTVFKETLEKDISHGAFFAPWGFFGQSDKVFYDTEKVGYNRWLMDPFKLIEKVYKTRYPIPETTTKKGKRIAYIHIDGDGILSKSFNQKFTIENGLDFLKKYPIKSGVSYIAVELDKDGPIFKNPMFKNIPGFKAELFNKNAKEILELPYIEPASHTYTHPFNWREGMVAYSKNKNAKRVLYEGKISAFQEETKEINLDYEIKESINYIQKLIPSKKVNTVYWTGDCYPSLKDMEYIDKNNLLAFNGGDSRFDLQFNSYSYVMPLSLYNKRATQIYSSNSNENTYTEDWTENYWRFKKVITTFEKTGYPKRIKPVNVYYHFYSFAKKGSHNALEKIYSYLNKEDFEFIYPSEFIKIAQNFHDVKIKEIHRNLYEISNIKELKEFRVKGKKRIKSIHLKNVSYNKKLDVTYFRIKDNITNTKVEIY